MRIEVICPECGIKRLYVPSYAKRRKTSLCQKCNGRILALENGISFKKRELHPNWKGGITIHHGYRFIKVNKNHIYFDMADPAGRIAEHRLVMAESMERSLKPHEIVHYINGNKLDNRIDNLELVSASEHTQITQLQKRITELESRVKELELLTEVKPKLHIIGK